MLNEGRKQLHVYGIANCDTCRSTLRWLSTRNAPHMFHDIRKEGLAADLLMSWLSSSHGPYLVNKRSTTWRQFSDAQKQTAESGSDSARLDLLLANPTLLKRPVITDGSTILDIGFSPANLEDYI